MIRINLLPLRAERKKEDVRKMVTTYGAVVLGALLLLGYFHIAGSRKVSRLEAQLVQNESEIVRFKVLAEQIKVLEAQNKAVEQKLAVIEALDANRNALVHLLDELATQLPAGRLWLTELEQNQANLTIKGQAVDNESVAHYMRSLEATEYLKNVDLLGSEQKEFEGTKIKEFTLTCQLAVGGPPPSLEPEPGPGAKGKKAPGAAGAKKT
jgi:type IV pilus assembly protein PilN